MKTCAYCSTKVQKNEGRMDDEGNFVCLECFEEEGAGGGTPACPSCGESSDEYRDEGICPNCGHERGQDEEESEGKSEEADDSEETTDA